MNPSDVILAVASPPGHSLRGIIRISGAGALEALGDQLVFNEQRRCSRGAAPVRVRFNALEISALALVMPGPHSYTGEDSIELQMPGNPALLERVIDWIVQSAAQRGIAARRAEPGEFTARAFLNNRITLTQAEGVAASIAALSDAELRAASFLRRGSLGEFARQVADQLASALALVEAGIDFTDQEDVVAIAPSDLHRRLIELLQRLDDQLKHAVGIEQLQAIPWVVLAGAPNAGKSALFNALLGRERAVVSPVSGTTRDVLAEPLAISTAHGPAEVMLIDLAGLDEDEPSSINRLMQSAARQGIDRAELILRCIPADQDFEELGEDETVVVVQTKSDLRGLTPLAAKPGECKATLRNGLLVSAHTGEGLEELRARIAARLQDRAVSLAADATALRPRHEAALRSAATNLAYAIALVEPASRDRSLPHPELIASSMRAALDDFAALAGDITPDEVLGRIFATFCVGK